jgi:D-lactate dehydrogenase
MQKIGVYSAKPYDKKFFEAAAKGQPFEFRFFEDSLSEGMISTLSEFEIICLFVNDTVNRAMMEKLAEHNVKLIALRCAGFNNIALKAAKEFGIKVARVPEYSPYAVAEHALAMIMTLNRKTHRAHNRVRESNFSLNGLMGFDLNGKTVGVIGTGKIGQIFCKTMLALNCKVIAYDPYPNKALEESGVQYKSLESIFEQSDIISLQCPLTDQTKHLINAETIDAMKDGVMLINTSRGGLIHTEALIRALKSRKIGYLGIDVYEQEENIFFNDLSGQIIEDDLIMRLTTFPNVLITSHQAFFTDTALKNIADTTVSNINQFLQGAELENEVKID